MKDLFAQGAAFAAYGFYTAYDAVTDLTDDLKKKLNNSDSERKEREEKYEEELKTNKESKSDNTVSEKKEEVKSEKETKNDSSTDILKAAENVIKDIKEETSNESMDSNFGKKEEVKFEVESKAMPATQEKPKEEKANQSATIQEKKKEKLDKSKTEKSSEKKEEQKITVQARKSCPIKILSKEEKEKVKETKREKLDILNDEGFHHLSHFIEYLRNAGIQYSKPVKMDTGLYEIVIYSNGRQLPISVDVDGLLYCDEIKFFIGQVRPGEEYVKHPIMLTKEVLECLRNNTQIPAKYYIPDSLFNLNKVLDLQTLKEKDSKKREATFEHAAKAISDKDIYAAIVKAANGEPFRFAFCRYSSPEEFSIVSSKRNLSSNLSKDKLVVSKELWINYKDKKVDFSTKKAK